MIPLKSFLPSSKISPLSFSCICVELYLLTICFESIQNKLKRKRIPSMDDYFGQDEFDKQGPVSTVVQQQHQDAFEFSEAPAQPAYTNNQQAFAFSYQTSSHQETPSATAADDDEFDRFEEDETTRRIREEEERIQSTLREKSDREWQDKTARKAEGRRQFEEYLARKEHQKLERAAENLRKEAINKQELAKLNVEAGWRKVISNINVRAGEHKGKKEISRMRQSILHRREDDKR